MFALMSHLQAGILAVSVAVIAVCEVIRTVRSL